MLEKVWNLREYVQNIEEIVEEILNYLISLKDLDNSTRNIWISDVKAFFSNAVSAWEVLTATTEEGPNMKKIDESKSFLYAARNRLSQILSQLNIFQSRQSSILIEKVENAFDGCWNVFWINYSELSINEDYVKPTKRIIKISDIEYDLPCSVCSKIAVKFKIGYGRLDEKESLVFRGITLESSLSIDLANGLFKILEKDNLLGIHKFMQKYHSPEGVDAYCPECDKLYCWEHYDAKEEYDDGFYDCTYGECPKGHKRMIDD
jgi:hypothetical protein